MLRFCQLSAIVALVALSTGSAQAADPWKKIQFKSGDGLPITADLYLAHQDKKAPFIVLCHQARWSRGEYREIAPKLNEMGFNCMAIDQRSGQEVNGIKNETAARATKKRLGVTYLDARQDVIAALRYARSNFAKGKLLAWGSSYSSALVLEVVGTEKKLADGVLSFAPGEYFTNDGKPANWVAQGAAKLKVPVFVTSAKNEEQQWKKIFTAIPSEKKASFVPETTGNHGSRALWKRFADSKDYWSAVTKFLDDNFPRDKKKSKKKKKRRRR